jgi:hypothetical protein
MPSDLSNMSHPTLIGSTAGFAIQYVRDVVASVCPPSLHALWRFTKCAASCSGTVPSPNAPNLAYYSSHCPLLAAVHIPPEGRKIETPSLSTVVKARVSSVGSHGHFRALLDTPSSIIEPPFEERYEGVQNQ